MPSDVTQLLSAIEQGDLQAADELLPLVYGELRKLAAARLAKEPAGQTLQPTALVHEAWLKLAGSHQPFSGRGHFFSAAAEAMRWILIDRARRKRRLKRGGDWKRVDLDSGRLVCEAPPDELLIIDEAITRLGQEDPLAAELVKLRYFAGLSVEEAGDLVGLSRSTAYEHWAYARAWLFHEVRAGQAGS